jgi:hypothetical protein
MLNSTTTTMDPSGLGSGGADNGRAAMQSSQTTGSEFLKFKFFILFYFYFLSSERFGTCIKVQGQPKGTYNDAYLENVSFCRTFARRWSAEYCFLDM